MHELAAFLCPFSITNKQTKCLPDPLYIFTYEYIQHFLERTNVFFTKMVLCGR